MPLRLMAMVGGPQPASFSGIVGVNLSGSRPYLNQPLLEATNNLRTESREASGSWSSGRQGCTLMRTAALCLVPSSQNAAARNAGRRTHVLHRCGPYVRRPRSMTRLTNILQSWPRVGIFGTAYVSLSFCLLDAR